MSTRKRPPSSRTSGMTLVELMVVVVIIGVLAALATVGYRRYLGRARLSEANAMLAELAAKEQLYFMENGAFVPARGDDDLTQPSKNEDPSNYIPWDPTAAGFESVRTAHPVPVDPSSNAYKAWRRIGLRPRWPQLYCTYLVNAGLADQSPPSGLGAGLWGGVIPKVPWFYAIAACNLNGDTAVNTQMVTVSDSPGIRTFNDGQ